MLDGSCCPASLEVSISDRRGLAVGCNLRVMYSLIIPVYKNQETILPLLSTVEDINVALGHTLEAIFVVDGSPDASYGRLRQQLPGRRFSAQLIALSRNFGSFSAIRTGLSLGHGPYFAVMTADLQEPPQLILDFFAALREGDVDVVVGTRVKRDDPALIKLSSGLFWGIYRRLVDHEMPTSGVDVFGCNATVRDTLVSLGEANTSLIGLLFWLGFRRRLISYNRVCRPIGRSGWTFAKRVRYALDTLFSFTDLPIMLLTIMGAAGIGITALIVSIMLAVWLAVGILASGYAWIIVSMLLSTSVILFALGLIGGYMWRAFENTKERPTSVVMHREIFHQVVEE